MTATGTVSSTAVSSTALPPAWRAVARIGWICLAAACLSLFLLGTLESIQAPLPSCATPGTDCSSTPVSQEDAQTAASLGLPVFPMIALIGSVAAKVSLALVSLIIFWRRSDDWLALMMSGSLITVLIEGGHVDGASLDLLLKALFAIGTALFLPLPFIFPSGRWEPRGLRLPVLALTAVYAVVASALTNTPVYFALLAALTLIWSALAVWSMAFRYRRVSSPVERQQTKWVLMGLVATLFVGTYYSVANAAFPASQPSVGRIWMLVLNGIVYVVGYGFFAFSFLVAILRYRLWDIDLLIRRTLQYSLLSGLLALIYFSLVTALQAIVRSLTDQESSLSVVISTLAIAALFSPLRNRLQTFIDGRFDRHRYDSQRVLADFAATCRDETDLDRLTLRLAEAVQETLQPETVAVWLRGAARAPGDERRPT